VKWKDTSVNFLKQDKKMSHQEIYLVQFNPILEV